jgi:hypothetical protein
MASRFESGGGEHQSGGPGMSNGYSGRHDVLLDGRDNLTPLAVAHSKIKYR